MAANVRLLFEKMLLHCENAEKYAQNQGVKKVFLTP